MFNKVLPNLHEIGRALEAELSKDKPKGMSVEELRAVQKLLKVSIESLNTRLFVVMSAAQNGWNFARQLQFLEDGITCYLSVLRGRFFHSFPISLGGGANENYMKLAKQFQKRQEKKEDEREMRTNKAKLYDRPPPRVSYLIFCLNKGSC